MTNVEIISNEVSYSSRYVSAIENKRYAEIPYLAKTLSLIIDWGSARFPRNKPLSEEKLKEKIANDAKILKENAKKAQEAFDEAMKDPNTAKNLTNLGVKVVSYDGMTDEEIVKSHYKNNESYKYEENVDLLGPDHNMNEVTFRYNGTVFVVDDEEKLIVLGTDSEDLATLRKLRDLLSVCEYGPCFKSGFNILSEEESKKLSKAEEGYFRTKYDYCLRSAFSEYIPFDFICKDDVPFSIDLITLGLNAKVYVGKYDIIVKEEEFEDDDDFVDGDKKKYIEDLLKYAITYFLTNPNDGSLKLLMEYKSKLEEKGRDKNINSIYEYTK